MISFRALAFVGAVLFAGYPHVVSAAADLGRVLSDPATSDHRLPAVHIDGPLTIDGALDESAWRDAPVADGFIQAEPAEGQPASEPTEVRVLYDDSALYLGVFARDSDARGIIVNELKKDFDTSGGDVFEIVIDTFGDGRNGYMFSVNPMGARWDAQMVNEGRDINSNWDGIWSVATRITPQGWYAEIAIPFRTLRFANGDSQNWGINFHRRIRRRNEDSYWSPIPRIFALTRVSLAGSLSGLQGVRPGRDLRLKPYALTSGTTVASQPGSRDFQAGFDAKYGVTTGLTWDFTVNTDFSQVEADEQQINLTRFSVFFPEKRDFFLENSGVFQFGTPNPSGGMGGAGGGRTNGLAENVLFFSRQIGLSENGEALPILGGTRLTGHAGAFTIGALNIEQRRSDSTPATNFTAVRVRRNVLANSDVGVLLLNKSERDGPFNRVVGADANFRFFDNLNVNGFLTRSMSPATVVGREGSEAMWRAGMSYRGDIVETTVSYNSTGERFNDELGFIPRVGIDRLDVKFGPHLRPAPVQSWLREIYPHFALVNITRDAGGGFDSRYMDFHLPFNFQNSAFIEVGRNTNLEVLAAPFTINRRRDVSIDPGRYGYDEYFVTGNTDRGRAISFNGRFGTGTFYDGTKRTYLAGAQLRVNARLNGGVSILRNVIDLSRGSYTTDLVAGRINYSFSTRAFLNALIQYNTDVQEWSSNIRLDVIHHPLSDIFLVYNDHRDTVTGTMRDRSVAAKVTYLLAF